LEIAYFGLSMLLLPANAYIATFVYSMIAGVPLIMVMYGRDSFLTESIY